MTPGAVLAAAATLPGVNDYPGAVLAAAATGRVISLPLLRSSLALRAIAWAAVAAGASTPLLRRRLRLPVPAVTALSFQAPVALAIATPRTRLRDAGIYALQMWAYYAHYDMPDDDPDSLLRRTRVHYPIRFHRALGMGRLPTTRLQDALARGREVRAH